MEPFKPVTQHPVSDLSLPERARAAFSEWQSRKKQNYFEHDADLQTLLRHHLGEAVFEQESPGFSRFGQECATVLDELICENNRDEHLPTLRRYDGIGRRTEEVCFHPSYYEIGRLAYRTGAMSRYETPGQERIQLAYAYLLAHHGEGGHLCPFACTAGLIKLLLARADDALKARLLPGLLHTDRLDPAHHHGAQFLTEIQGGSDVGQNVVRATPCGDFYRINGEKWFCSVIDADLYLVTARIPHSQPGTAGLGAFVVPRRLRNGSPNGVFIRRLKYKLGTRSMASGEADFVDAVAWSIGAPEGAFKQVVDIVLNTSRTYNAIAACGMMRRAEIEATTFAACREAFGQKIAEFPLVKRTLGRITESRRKAIAGTFALIALADQVALGVADENTRAVHRLVVNMNKYFTAVRGTTVVRDAIEVLGGNGTIEEFSVLPRLLRDSIVIEAWEGTHNVLCAQVLRDMQKLHLHQAFFAHLRRWTKDQMLLAEIADAEERVRRLMSLQKEDAALEIRDTVDVLMSVWQNTSVHETLPRAHNIHSQ